MLSLALSLSMGPARVAQRPRGFIDPICVRMNGRPVWRCDTRPTPDKDNINYVDWQPSERDHTAMTVRLIGQRCLRVCTISNNQLKWMVIILDETLAAPSLLCIDNNNKNRSNNCFPYGVRAPVSLTHKAREHLFRDHHSVRHIIIIIGVCTFIWEFIRCSKYTAEIVRPQQ